MAQRTQTWTCQQCGNACERVAVRGRFPKFCDPTCYRRHDEAQRAARGTCTSCGSEFVGTRREQTHCSLDCSAKAQAITRRSTMTRAVEVGDFAAAVTIARKRVRVTGGGCWTWQGASMDGYPVMQIGKRKSARVHRVLLELKLGRSLGSEAAHHMCANSMCVNPDHLQPVTARDNNAEMMARRAYLARISELEAALAVVSPDHPLLDVLPFGL